MSVTALCEICQSPGVDHTCDRCGQLVCDRHYDDDVGLCVECSAEVGNPDEENIPGGEDLPDGVDTYEF